VPNHALKSDLSVMRHYLICFNGSCYNLFTNLTYLLDNIYWHLTI